MICNDHKKEQTKAKPEKGNEFLQNKIFNHCSSLYFIVD